MIKAIIFDCFGVIITDAMQLVRQELDSKDPEAGRRMHDFIVANNRGIITPEESNKGIAELLGITVEDFRSRIDRGEVRDQRLLEYIVGLRQDYKTAMLSNIARSSLLRRFTIEELQQYFDAVIISGDIGFAKPEPEAYEAAAEQLGLRFDECLFTDDREEFCEAARGVGMKTLTYHSLDQFKQELNQLLSLQK